MAEKTNKAPPRPPPQERTTRKSGTTVASGHDAQQRRDPQHLHALARRAARYRHEAQGRGDQARGHDREAQRRQDATPARRRATRSAPRPATQTDVAREAAAARREADEDRRARRSTSPSAPR